MKGDDLMTQNNNTNKTNTASSKPQVLPRQVLRERLRLSASQCSEQISRSVARISSCDALPCLEYGEEVERERAMIGRLLYLPHCRTALERCLDCGSARLRYRWEDGRVTVTSFRRLRQGRVQVRGLDGLSA